MAFTGFLLCHDTKVGRDAADSSLFLFELQFRRSYTFRRSAYQLNFETPVAWMFQYDYLGCVGCETFECEAAVRG